MDLKRVEIFRTGRWNDIKTFTNDDLDSMVASFKAMRAAGRVPLKFGHNDMQPFTDGQPALGWVQRLWREGDVLLADFTQLPTVVYNAIKSAAYKFVSVELLRDIEFEGVEYPWVLTAIALLGADIPAVSGLKDLQALAMSRRTALQAGAPLTFTRGISSTGDRGNMTDEKKLDLSELSTKVDELSSKLSTFAADNATLKAENQRLKDAAETREREIKREKVSQHRNAIKARFDAAINEKRIIPSSRDLFERNPTFKNDDSVLDLSLDFVDSYIKEHTVQGFKPKTGGSDGGDGRDTLGGDASEANLAADVIVARRVDKLVMSQQGRMTYRQATAKVLRDDPELAEKYRMHPGVKGGEAA